MAIEKARLQLEVASIQDSPIEPEMLTKKMYNSMVQPSEAEIKKIQLDPEVNPSKYAVIGKDLDPK